VEIGSRFLWSQIVSHAIFPIMSDHGSDGQRRDALLLRLLKSPPKPRPKRERSKGNPIQSRAKRASAEKPAPAT